VQVPYNQGAKKFLGGDEGLSIQGGGRGEKRHDILCPLHTMDFSVAYDGIPCYLLHMIVYRIV